MERNSKLNQDTHFRVSIHTFFLGDRYIIIKIRIMISSIKEVYINFIYNASDCKKSVLHSGRITEITQELRKIKEIIMMDQQVISRNHHNCVNEINKTNKRNNSRGTTKSLHDINSSLSSAIGAYNYQNFPQGPQAQNYGTYPGAYSQYQQQQNPNYPQQGYPHQPNWQQP